MAKFSLLDSFSQNGFVLVPSILTPSQLILLREASTRTISLARAGKWLHVRTLPKQFPPWTTNGSNPAAEGIWGVQFLMHPSIPDCSIFTREYFSSSIITVVKELLQCEDEELVMELFNLLVRPDYDFELRWHRDDISAEASAEDEVEILRMPAWHTQWNLVLYDDESLVVVPGSQTRARTEAERGAGPFEKEMPEQLVVRMKAGDVIFYNSNILHRGVYDSTVERMTLHGSMGHVKGSSHRARNVLQHGVREWVERIDLGVLDNEDRKRAEGMWERLVKMGLERGEVGYSLED
jgi:hypothetical protein